MNETAAENSCGIGTNYEMNLRMLSNLRKAMAIGFVALVTAALAADVFARVGGGGSYGGGGGHGPRIAKDIEPIGD